MRQQQPNPGKQSEQDGGNAAPVLLCSNGNCTKPTTPPYKKCAHCRKKLRKRTRERREKLIHAGLCREACGRPANALSHYCNECYTKSLARNRVKKEQKIQ